MTSSRRPHVRLAELMAAISLATDLGTGQPMGHALRTCYLAVGIARELGCSLNELFDTYYLSLLRFLGCTAEATADARLNGGDEIGFYAGLAPSLMGRPGEAMGWMLRHLAEREPALRRARAVAAVVSDPKGAERSFRAHCEVGQMLARRVGLGESVLHALGCAFERWDGKGWPNGIAGEDIPRSCRVALVARDFDLLTMVGGDEAERVLSARKARAYDPNVLEAALELGPALRAEVDGESLWDVALGVEPAPVLVIEDGRVDGVLEAFADFVDLKSPFLHGHSSGVAELAQRAADVLGGSVLDGRQLRRAGLVHDLGRVGVPSGIWNKEGRLTSEEWERVRLHPYYTERILVRCSPLKDLAEVASSHHERNDGSGYHRGVRSQALSTAARLLGAADAFRAMTEARPHRPALSSGHAAQELNRACEQGALDPAAARAVLEAAGEGGKRPRAAWPAGLTDREVEVLRLLATGISNRQIARTLTVSPKTVGRHVEHIYAKAAVSTRAGATLFALEHGLVGR